MLFLELLPIPHTYSRPLRRLALMSIQHRSQAVNGVHGSIQGSISQLLAVVHAFRVQQEVGIYASPAIFSIIFLCNFGALFVALARSCGQVFPNVHQTSSSLERCPAVRQWLLQRSVHALDMSSMLPPMHNSSVSTPDIVHYDQEHLLCDAPGEYAVRYIGRRKLFHSIEDLVNEMLYMMK
jgi:hypothetical protein